MDGYPPKKDPTRVSAKMDNGMLIQIAERIRPGQYVEHLSSGSMGKLATIVKDRGYKVILRKGSGESRGTVYVVTEEWLADNPSV